MTVDGINAASVNILGCGGIEYATISSIVVYYGDVPVADSLYTFTSTDNTCQLENLSTEISNKRGKVNKI